MPVKFACVIAALNEADLPATLADFQADSVPERSIVVDDAGARRYVWQAGAVPQVIRLPARFGVARARRVGCVEAFRDPSIDAVAIRDGHMRDTPEAIAAQWNQDIPGDPCERHPGTQVRGKMRALAELACQEDAIVYCGCNAHYRATLAWDHGLLRCKWRAATAQPVMPSAGMMGAMYVLPRAIHDRFGGWPQLPGHWGLDEEALSLLACAHKVPILCHSGVQTFHQFRGDKPDHHQRAPQPYVLYVVKLAINYFAAMRLVCDATAWKDWRAKFLTQPIPTDHPDAAGNMTFYDIPAPDREIMLRELETPAYTRYVESVQSPFTLKDTAAILAEAERRMRYDEAIVSSVCA